MSFLASVNGLITPVEEARVSVLDNGFAFGDSVYEVLRTYSGSPFEPGRHFRRLRASAARLGFEVGLSDEELLGRASLFSLAQATRNRTSESSSAGASATARTTSTRCTGPRSS